MWTNFPLTVFLNSSRKLMGPYDFTQLFLNFTGFFQNKSNAWGPQVYAHTKPSTFTQNEGRLSWDQCQCWGHNAGVIRVYSTSVLLGLALLLGNKGDRSGKRCLEGHTKLMVTVSLFINWLQILIGLLYEYAHRWKIGNAN